MLVERLWLTDFRSYRSATLELAPGLTAVVGANGQGKTNLLEAIGYLATLSSFRGAPPDALIRIGATSAVVRAEASRDDRSLLIEAEIVAGGRNRVQVNRQRLRRARDLLGAIRVSVFSPDDLTLVKGGPGERRRYLDDTLVALHPRHDQLRSDVERILKQRNALLKQAGGGRLDDTAAFTLDVWDAKLADAGDALVRARLELVEQLEPRLRGAYRALAGDDAADVGLRYERSWDEPSLADALVAARRDDLRRGITTVGPHRDDLALSIAGMPSRTHASQGEQRSMALALRLGAHHEVTEMTGSPPILLLDDVFSELDPERSDALLRHLPPGQALVTSAIALPPQAEPDSVLRLDAGVLVPAG